MFTMDTVIFLFIVGLLKATGSILPGEAVRYVLDESTCGPRNIKTQTMDNFFILKSSGDKSTNSTAKARKCVSNITFHGFLNDTCMGVYFFKDVGNAFDISVTYTPSNESNVNNSLPSGEWVNCLTSPDHVTKLEINYSLRKGNFGNITADFFKTKGVQTCPLESITSIEDKPFIQEDQYDEIGESDEPKVGTAKTTNVAKEKTPLDVIIIAGVGVAAVVGIGLSVFAIRRWIRNNAAEERRQSVIRVNSNSQGSQTRSTSNRSNSLQSTTRTAQQGDRGYGSVMIGGRLPSSEDDSDLFPDDTKSAKTILEDD